MRRPAPFIAFVAVLLVADQLSKWLVFRALALDDSVPVLDGILHFKPVLNRGAAFSMLASHTWIITLIAAAAVVGMSWWYARARATAHLCFLVALGLLLAGASGNLIDRMLPPHAVRDFFEFIPPVPLVGQWAIFNVADVCICVGVGLFVVAEFFFAPDDEEEKEDAAVPAPPAAETANGKADA